MTKCALRGAHRLWMLTVFLTGAGLVLWCAWDGYQNSPPSLVIGAGCLALTAVAGVLVYWACLALVEMGQPIPSATPATTPGAGQREDV